MWNFFNMIQFGWDNYLETGKSPYKTGQDEKMSYSGFGSVGIKLHHHCPSIRQDYYPNGPFAAGVM